ncbi:hypothetical protein BJ165DRAFT_1592981 [Panaeolus papilionaceus]|nr:hypothetical protein BJ165DRAFT_1592981 [Panaeolus papilionaceus]
MWIQPDTSATHELAQAAADNPPNLNASGPSETLPSPSEAPGSPGEAPTHGMTGSEPQEHGDQTQQPGTRIQREDPRPYSDQVPPAPPIDEDLSAPVVQHGDNANAHAQPESSNHKMSINQFGVYRVYPTGLPTYNPDINFHIGIVSNNPNFDNAVSPAINPDMLPPAPGPFKEPSSLPPALDSPYPNKTIELIMSWYYMASNTKSLNDLNVLICNVILSDDFNKKDLKNFDAAKAVQTLDNVTNSNEPLTDGWKRASIALPLPYPRCKNNSEDDAPVHIVEGLLHRNLKDIITSAYAEPSAAELHISPFEEYWKPDPNSPPERIYSELYNSNALLQEHESIRQQPRPGCNLETVVMPIMQWSDATHLTSFGDASLWPIYLYNGYQSKYSRSKPTSFAAHHVAYIPKCSIHKQQIQELGTVRDSKRRSGKHVRTDNNKRQATVNAACRLIYVNGLSVNSAAVEERLADKSLTPTQNAFSERLSPYGFDFYSMFVVDLLHEFELGVWKATFTHLLRILFVGGPDNLQILNIRYRQVPAFGRTIRRFSSNASAMKRLAARDFEDLLQCAIPVFDGLLEKKHNDIISDLLFELATWHALAKLRLHTESTIQSLENSTTHLGKVLRKFQSVTCDYAQTIRTFGPTDGYSTQLGELEHRRCKRFYPCVHKGKRHYARGIAVHISRERRLHNLGKISGIQMTRPTKKQRVGPKRHKALVDERLLPSRASDHYQISVEMRNPIPIRLFLSENNDDPAVKDFLPRLRDHIFGRLLNQQYDGDDNPFSSTERAQVLFRNHTMFGHKTMRINYTTYDMRHEQDTINPRTNPNIMVLSPDGEDHPYWYAKVIGIYHVLVVHQDLQPQPKLMHFLWIHWYGLEPSRHYKFGWKARRLPRVGFVDDSDDDPMASPTFGFIDPANVIRAVHLIPAFHHEHTKGLLGPSTLARQPEEDDADWNFFYINIFADRDMVMRFRGSSVGHKSTQEATNRFLDDRPTGDTHLLSVCTQEEERMDVDDGEEESGELEEATDLENAVGSEEEVGDEHGEEIASNSNSNSDGGDENREDDEMEVEEEIDSDEEVEFGYAADWDAEDDEENLGDPSNLQDEVVSDAGDELPQGEIEDLGYAAY